MNNCILSIDQGTTSSRAILFNDKAQALFSAQQEFPQIYPDDGWVEHDPEAIWSSTLAVVGEVLEWGRSEGWNVLGIGITNQRETTLIWDKATGEPIYNAIVWQDRRTASVCDELRKRVSDDEIQQRSGLLLDPYFSATKAAWILDHVEGARERAEAGELAFGTVDSFLIWRLTGGKSHLTDATNASRTNLYHLEHGNWDDWLLELFRVPRAMLPEVRDCASQFGNTESELTGGISLPILGVAGDQQAASIGQCCFQKGQIKSTYGTGCFVLLNTGDELVFSRQRLLSTLAWQLDGKRAYALEGSIFIAGAVVQWLRDQLGIIKSAAETEDLASGIESTKGVYLVPAFTGLGVPYWRADARGELTGLTRASGKAEIVRAALESVCYQTSDLFSAMEAEGMKPVSLRVDGGMVANDWLLQFMADILDMEVLRPSVLETTALGAAYLAGKQAGFYGDFESFSQVWCCTAEFHSNMKSNERQMLLAGWKKAVQKVLN